MPKSLDLLNVLLQRHGRNERSRVRAGCLVASSQRTEGCAQVARGGTSAVVNVRHDACNGPAQSELRVDVDVEVGVHADVVDVGGDIIFSNGSGS